MKKVFAIIITMVIVLGASIGTMAESLPKYCEVILSTSAEIVNVGETVELNALTLKRGSSYTVEWNGAEDTGTVLDKDTGNYVSTAIFKADKPGIYTVTYKIQMNTGNTNTFFEGTAFTTIEVRNPVTVVGADIRDLVIKPLLKPEGTVSGYLVQGNTYIVWSNNTSTLYGTVSFFMGTYEISKDIYVMFNVEGKQYTYNVTVTRE